MMTLSQILRHWRCLEIDEDHSVCLVKPARIRRRDFATDEDYQEAIRALPPTRFEGEES